MRGVVSSVIKILLYGVFLGLVGESTLRLQQLMGPITDLEFKSIELRGISDVLNHENIPGVYTFIENNIEDLKGRELTYVYDEDGLKINPLKPNANQSPDYKILYLGDSFMDGYEDGQTIPEWVRVYFQQTPLSSIRIAHWNAGCSSYSPSIFIPQAKKLIPKLKPDFVVVDIDNTDLGDDAFRYRDLVVRNDVGEIIAVRHSSLHADHLQALDRIRHIPLYFLRLVFKIYHQAIELPRWIKAYERVKPRDALSIVSDPDPDARQKYQLEIDIFKSRVDELAKTLVSLMGDEKRVAFIYHPHLQQLQPDEHGFLWHSFVAEILKEVSEKHGFDFYDATADLKKMFLDAPSKFYFEGDMHFNYEGMRLYGQAVSYFLYAHILPLVQEARLLGETS